MITVEMYPWHSKSVTAAMHPPASVLDEFVWAPLAEIAVPLFFAFGARWARMCEQLGLEPENRWGAGGKDFGSAVKSRTVITYRLSEEQRVVVSWPAGLRRAAPRRRRGAPASGLGRLKPSSNRVARLRGSPMNTAFLMLWWTLIAA
jgi:hypothetical protein